MSRILHDVVVANLHRRFTGVSATVAALVPRQRQKRPLSVIDTGGLGLGGELRFGEILRMGWRRTPGGKPRIWHARRDVEMIAGLVLRALPGQRWRVVFTSAAPKRHGAVLRFLMNRMDAIIATSPRSAAYLDWYSTIIPHGVDTERFHPASDRAAALAEAGTGARHAIGVFGRVRPSKGTDLFVEAMCALLPRYPDFVAVITGLAQPRDADFLAGMRARTAEAGVADRVLFLGDLPMDEVTRWYQRIGICVAASRSEGFGLTPLEAFASGACAVTSGAGYWPWLVDADVGALFETGNAADLIAKLEPIMADPARMEQMGRNARERAVARHSIDTEAQAINAVYAKLAEGPLPRIRPDQSMRAAAGAK